LSVHARRPLRELCPLLFYAPPTTGIYTLSLHDALPILAGPPEHVASGVRGARQHEQQIREPVEIGDRDRVRDLGLGLQERPRRADRKSTRLNSSHVKISYAVFCLKKKNCTFMLAPVVTT